MLSKQFVYSVMLAGAYGLIMTAQATPTSYTIQSVPINPDLSNSALLLNDTGQIAGSEQILGANAQWLGSRGFFWRDGTLTYFGGNTLVKGLNNKGQVIGFNGAQGFVWSDGVLNNLGSPSQNDYFATTAINQKGQVLLKRFTPESNVEGLPADIYIWDNGNQTRLDGLLDANAINDNGQVAGSISINGQRFSGERPAVWSNATITVLKTPVTFSAINTTVTARRSMAQFINDNGQVAGSLGGLLNDNPNIPVSHSFSWSNGTMMHLIDDDARRNLVAAVGNSHFDITDLYTVEVQGLNSQGQVAGNLGDRYPFLYSEALNLKLIPLLGYCENAGLNYGRFGGMNDAGVIVGLSRWSCDTSYAGATHALHAYIYESNGIDKPGITTDLNTLISGSSGWELTNAHAINNRGQILVSGNKGYALLTPSNLKPDSNIIASCDANQDHKIDTQDLILMQGYTHQYYPAFDVDGDGVVGFGDFRKCVLQCTKPKCAS